MNKFLNHVIKILTSFAIAFTITFSPVVFNYPVNFSSIAYASDDCEKDDPDQKNYLYRPGCQFNEDAADMKEIDSKIIDYIIYSLINFSMLSMLFVTATRRAWSDAPVSAGTTTTIPVVLKTGVLFTLINEFYANSNFRDELTRDFSKELTGKKTDDKKEIDKQVKILNQLESVYLKQAEYADLKATGASALGLTYNIAFGSEGANIIGHKINCGSTRSGVHLAMQKSSNTLNALSTTLTTLNSGLAAGFADPNPAVDLAAINCSTFSTLALAKAALYKKHIIAVEASSTALVTEIESRETVEKAASTSAYTQALQGALSDVMSFFGIAQNIAHVSEEEARMAANQKILAASQLESKGTAALIKGDMKACGASLAAASSCAGISQTPGCAAVLSFGSFFTVQAPLIVESIVSAEVALDTPIYGCGSDGLSATGVPIQYRMPIPQTSLLFDRKDLLVQGITGANIQDIKLKDMIQRMVEQSGDKEFDVNKFFQTDKMRKYGELTLPEMIEKVVFNLMYQEIVHEVIQKNHKDHIAEYKELRKKLLKLKKYFDNRDFKKEFEKVNLAQIQKSLKNLDKRKEYKRANPFLAEVFKMIKNFGLMEARADGEEEQISNDKDDSSSTVEVSETEETVETPESEAFIPPEGAWWMDLLGMGLGTAALYYALSSWVKNSVMKTPARRVFLWYSLGILSNLMAMKHALLRKEASQRADIVASERNKFVGAIGEGSEFDQRAQAAEDNKINKKKSLVRKNNNKSVCATLGGSGEFLPAQCPSKIAPRAFQLPNRVKTKNSSFSPLALDAFSSIAASSSKVASTGEVPTGQENANLRAEFAKKNKALRKANRKIREKLESLTKDQDKKGTGFKSILSKVEAAINNPKTFSPVPLASLKSLGEKAKIENEKKGLSTPKNIAAFEMPKIPKTEIPNMDFNIDGLGDLDDLNGDLKGAKDSEKGEKDLGDFVIEHNDINRKKEVSIFKILSNRYILTYPKIVPEKKSIKSAPKEVAPKDLEGKLQEL